jgi:hypothetical protein
MWYKAAPLSKEEKKAKIAEYKAQQKALKAEEKSKEQERAEALKKLSPEEKAAREEAKKAKAKEAKEKAEADKKAAQAQRKADKASEKAALAKMSDEEKKEYQAKKKAEHKTYVNQKFAEYKKNHDETVAAKGEALSHRYDFGGKWKRFWFNVGQTKFCQGYMNWWRKLEIGHPELSKWLYQIFYFIVFSEGVTIWQYLVLTFLPILMGAELAGTDFSWPKILMATYTDPATKKTTDLFWNIFGYPVVHDLETGNVKIGGGLGYFIAFEIATFTAQVINFPCQRNITFKSHGNPWWQAMWYFIGWVAISLICNMFNGLWMPFAAIYMDAAIYNLLVMFCTGGISMVIFFFIFRIIFPAGEAPKDDDLTAGQPEAK